MTRNQKLLLMMATLVAVAAVSSACEITLPMADCSGINQPDMGGLVCLGLNTILWQALALIAAAVLGLGAAALGVG